MNPENKKITTPIWDFVKTYAESNGTRLHMPGHKGQDFLGCESFDITEISGADSLYEANGIIAESENNASNLFGSGCTLFSTEGSSQCIRAMIYLAMLNKRKKSKDSKRPVIAAVRNAHKAFVYAAALLDIDVIWLWPEEKISSVCSCAVSLKQVEKVLDEHEEIVALYLTSPDYLGAQADIRGFAEVCHKRNVVLAVDNAHGAYLKFLEPSKHPLDLGADICCDSAHKTLPVLTGGAYLHISKNAPKIFSEQAKHAMALFGSTSPSYLTMISLDLCNHYLSGGYTKLLKAMIELRCNCCEELETLGWRVVESDPLKITIEIPSDISNSELTQRLQHKGVECEYADQNYIVFMLTPENTKVDLERLVSALGKNQYFYKEKQYLTVSPTTQKISIREAMFSVSEKISLAEAENRICRVPTVSCPPAIPIAVPGEIITKELISVFQHYGILQLDVVKE